MNEDEKRHEDKCKELFELYFYKLASDGTNDGELTHISDRFDGLVKIEDFAVKWREANHAWVKVWAPTFISLVLAVAGIGAGLQACATYHLEKRKMQADIVLRAAREKREETKTNLEALKGGGLLDLKSEEIDQLSAVRPPILKKDPQ